MAGGTGGATTDNRSVNAGIGGGLTAIGTSGVVDFTAGTPVANVTLNIDQYGNSFFDIDIVQEGTGGWCQTNANQSLQGQRGCCLCRTETTPLGKRSHTVQLEIDS